MITDKNRKYFLTGIIAFSVLLSSLSFYFYQVFYSPNILMEEDEITFLKIPKGADFRQVSDSLYHNNMVQDMVSFSFVAKLMGYQENIKPGRYAIKPKLTNRELIQILRSGKQTPLNITFNNIRTKDDLADKITRNLFLPKEEFLELLHDSTEIQKYGFEEETVMGMFIPNTYEVYWTITAKDLFDRMHSEYQKFWNEERVSLAKSLGFSPKEISTLASIVQAETSRSDEKAKVAGVYINRIKKNMPLQADPTLIFAVGDFSIKRVLNVHKEIESPYNTYKYPGLPPGPINLPDVASLNSVLNYESHNYLYFCAKEDFSGYHAFAVSLGEHLNNARRYQNALNAYKIYQ